MIQNYSNLLTAETRDLYKKSSENDSIILVKTNSSIWVKAIEPYVDLRKEIALLRFTHASAKSGADELSNIGTPFTYIPRTPISEITTNSAWLYNAIAQYFILSKYSVYDFMDEIPEESIGDRKIKRYLESKLDEIREAKKTKNDEKVIAKVREIAEFFGYEINEDHVRAMLLTIINDEYHPAFHMDELSHVAITFHSSKGLEFDQVIVFANDYQLNDEVSIYNHYVAVTRAKSKLIIVLLSDVNDWAGRQYCKNLQKLFGEAGVWLEDVMRIV